MLLETEPCRIQENKEKNKLVEETKLAVIKQRSANIQKSAKAVRGEKKTPSPLLRRFKRDYWLYIFLIP